MPIKTHKPKKARNVKKYKDDAERQSDSRTESSHLTKIVNELDSEIIDDKRKIRIWRSYWNREGYKQLRKKYERVRWKHGYIGKTGTTYETKVISHTSIIMESKREDFMWISHNLFARVKVINRNDRKWILLAFISERYLKIIWEWKPGITCKCENGQSAYCSQRTVRDRLNGYYGALQMNKITRK